MLSNMPSRLLVPGSLVVAALLLTGCTVGTATPDPSATSSGSGEPQAGPPPELVTPNPVEADTLVVIHAIATAANGAQVSLEYQVHHSVPWDDVAGASMPEVMAEVCAESFTLDRFKTERWSFTRTNVTSIPVEGSADWPADAVIGVRPAPDPGSVVSRGFIVDAGDASSPCDQSKQFSVIGKGGMALGLPGDAAASGGLTGWATQAYGFRVGGDVRLSDCRVDVTSLGVEAGASTGSWSTAATATSCLAGASDRVG